MPTRRALIAAAAAAASTPALASSPASPTGTVTGMFAALYASDAVKLAEWHARMFGYELAAQGEPAQGPVARFALLKGAVGILEIIQPHNPVGEASPDKPRYEGWALGAQKIGFVHSDIEGLEARLRAQGAAFNHGMVRSPQLGKRTFAVRDPEGNTVQVFEA